MPSPPESRLSTLDYWEERYADGGDSGMGAAGNLGKLKAAFINAFVEVNRIETVLELGVGDGRQLELGKYPAYHGLDISPTVISLVTEKFHGDLTKRFTCIDPLDPPLLPVELGAELVLSLDVIFHLIEDDVYHVYMSRLFAAAERFVIIYSSNRDRQARDQAPHVFHRAFHDWVSSHQPEWQLLAQVKNRYPWNPVTQMGTWSDFYAYERIANR